MSADARSSFPNGWVALEADRVPTYVPSSQSVGRVTSENPGGPARLAESPRGPTYRPGWGPPPKAPVPAILSQYRDEYSRSQWDLREPPKRWRESRNPEHPPLVSSFDRPNPVVQAPFRGFPCEGELDTKRCNREALTEIGKRMIDDQACRVPQTREPKGPYVCPQEVTWQSMWIGTAPTFIPIEDGRCPNPGCPPSGRWDKVYRNPQEWNELYFKRAIEDGRQWNFYEHLDNRQKLLQFLASDFAARRGDPYTVPTVRPNPGVQTLAEARLTQTGLPPPQF